MKFYNQKESCISHTCTYIFGKFNKIIYFYYNIEKQKKNNIRSIYVLNIKKHFANNIFYLNQTKGIHIIYTSQLSIYINNKINSLLGYRQVHTVFPTTKDNKKKSNKTLNTLLLPCTIYYVCDNKNTDFNWHIIFFFFVLCTIYFTQIEKIK